MNKVFLSGRLGADPTLRQTGAGASVVNVRMATSKYGKKDGEKTEQTQWHRLVAFRKTAENMAQLLKKGSSVLIEGELQTRSFEKEGRTQYVTEVIVHSFEMTSDGRNGNSSIAGSGGPEEYFSANPEDDTPF